MSRTTDPSCPTLPVIRGAGRRRVDFRLIGGHVLLASPSPDDDWSALPRGGGLGLIGAAGRIFIAALNDRKDHVRYMAAKGLGLIGDLRAVAHLKEAQRDENEFVRRAAATALGKIGGAEAVTALRGALENEASGGVRETILMALREAGVDGLRSGGGHLRATITVMLSVLFASLAASTNLWHATSGSSVIAMSRMTSSDVAGSPSGFMTRSIPGYPARRDRPAPWSQARAPASECFPRMEDRLLEERIPIHQALTYSGRAYARLTRG